MTPKFAVGDTVMNTLNANKATVKRVRVNNQPGFTPYVCYDVVFERDPYTTVFAYPEDYLVLVDAKPQRRRA